MAKGVIDLFLLYQFLRRLVQPFDSWDAYKTGVIDKDGNVIVKSSDRTMKQDQSWGYYDRLVANLKKLLAKIPGGRLRISSFAAALLLLREENIDPDDTILLEQKLYQYLDEAKYIQEEVPPANAVGSGNIHGVGVGPFGEPGYKRNKKDDEELHKLLKRASSIIKR